MDNSPSPPSKRQIVTGALSVLAVSATVVVLFVLPAELGIDPTGVGKATRVIELSQPVTSNPYLKKGLQRHGVFSPSQTPLAVAPGAQDHWEFDLGPYERIELKYVLAEGKTMHFFWHSSLPLDYDMHAHPFKGGTSMTESYSIDKADHLGGAYAAPFTGIHGWYWQNRNMETVHLVLDASGDITGSKIFSPNGEEDRVLTPPK